MVSSREARRSNSTWASALRSTWRRRSRSCSAKASAFCSESLRRFSLARSSSRSSSIRSRRSSSARFFARIAVDLRSISGLSVSSMGARAVGLAEAPNSVTRSLCSVSEALLARTAFSDRSRFASASERRSSRSISARSASTASKTATLVSARSCSSFKSMAANSAIFSLRASSDKTFATRRFVFRSISFASSSRTSKTSARSFARPSDPPPPSQEEEDSSDMRRCLSVSSARAMVSLRASGSSSSSCCWSPSQSSTRRRRSSSLAASTAARLASLSLSSSRAPWIARAIRSACSASASCLTRIVVAFFSRAFAISGRWPARGDARGASPYSATRRCLSVSAAFLTRTAFNFLSRSLSASIRAFSRTCAFLSTSTASNTATLVSARSCSSFKSMAAKSAIFSRRASSEETLARRPLVLDSIFSASSSRTSKTPAF
mmetsp:Transcript_12284/g.40154  ORF Transcript_12284/g.40154 Transcript_12284/m.40154 type:complete len:435 (-) Transcript_12284:857-2161(-)